MKNSLWERIKYAYQVLRNSGAYETDIVIQENLKKMQDWLENYGDTSSLPKKEALSEVRKALETREKDAESREKGLSRSIDQITDKGIMANFKIRELEKAGLPVDISITPGDGFFRYFRQDYMKGEVSTSPDEPTEKKDNNIECSVTVGGKINFVDRLRYAGQIVSDPRILSRINEERDSNKGEQQRIRDLWGRAFQFQKNTEKEKEIISRESYLAKAEPKAEAALAQIAQINNAISEATRNVDETKPEHQVHAELIINSQIKKLQEEIGEVVTETDSKEAEEGDTTNRKIDAIKGKLLAIVMAYSETLNTSERVNTCRIGDKNITVDTFLNTMPEVFGYVSKETPKRACASEAVRKAITETYYECMSNLVYAGVVNDKRPEMGFHNVVDFDVSKRSEGLEALLNRYSGTEYECAKYLGDLGRHFVARKNPEPSPVCMAPELTPLMDSSVIDQLGNAIKDIDSVDER